ncbi:hypothetical protein GCM10023178_45450 [Actinomadura luteofluorescens]
MKTSEPADIAFSLCTSTWFSYRSFGIKCSPLDAYVRHFRLTVVRDAVAHSDAGLGDAALRMMGSNMCAEIVDAGRCF